MLVLVKRLKLNLDSLTILTLTTSASIILISYFKFFIANYILFSFNSLFEMLVFFLLIACSGWSIFKIVKTKSRERLKYILALLSLFISVAVWFLTARMDVALRLYYAHLSPKLEVLATEISTGKIDLIEKNTSKNKFIKNSEVYKGGITSVYIDDQDNLIFFQINSGYGYITGYVYSEDDQPLKNGDFGADFAYSEKLENNWYIGYLD